MKDSDDSDDYSMSFSTECTNELKLNKPNTPIQSLPRPPTTPKVVNDATTPTNAKCDISLAHWLLRTPLAHVTASYKKI